MAKRENWVKLDVAQFCIEVFRNSDNLAEWTKSLAECLAYNDPSKNSFGALLLEEAGSFRESKVAAARKRWDAQHMQNDAQHMQNDANTSNDVVLCNVSSSSDLKDLEKIEDRNDTASARESGDHRIAPEMALESPITNNPTESIPEHKIEPAELRKREKTANRRSSGRCVLNFDGFSADFERWWKAYPRSPHKTRKPQAFEVWKSAGDKLPPIDAMLLTLEWQSNTSNWQRDGGQYIPKPENYLSGMRWLDEPPMSQAEIIMQGQQDFERYMAERKRAENGQY